MKSAWTDADAEDAKTRWSQGEGGADLGLRVYSGRLLGADPSLVLHGGGNVSLKGPAENLFGEVVEAIWVKGSGRDLADLTPEGLTLLELAPLRRLLELPAMTDSEMTKQFSRCQFDPEASSPSIETLVHAALPHRYVDHSHADALLALTNRPDGEERIRELFGEDVGILPYVFPGFDLARAVRELFDSAPSVKGLVLLHHGLFTFGDSARESYERHIDLVHLCERSLEERIGSRTLTASTSEPGRPPEELVATIAPWLRGRLARETGHPDRPHALPILEWRGGVAVRRVVESREAAELCASGPVTTDHLIRTGKNPCFVPEPQWDDLETLKGQIDSALEETRTANIDSIATQSVRQGVPKESRLAANASDPNPKVILLPGAGALCFGATKKDARIAADITEQTLGIKERAQLDGGFLSLSDDHLFDMEFRSLQLKKLARRDDRPLESRVVAISGGAGAIGAAVAEVCAAAGAHVVVTDVDETGLRGVVDKIEARWGRGSAMSLVMDVTDPKSVDAGFDEVRRHYGGIDVLVPNAGIAHVAPVEALGLEDFRRVLDVNLVGYLLFIQAGVRCLKEQGRGGHVVINASKNVFGPGKDFGAYSASKAAGHQLGKVSAIELAPHGIRVNMINADAVFGHDSIRSGLWEEVGPDRAKSRGLEKDDLPEYYRNRNLLKVRVYGHHVGNAVIYFASNQSPTTGATLPVDGGVVDAFPR